MSSKDTSKLESVSPSSSYGSNCMTMTLVIGFVVCYVVYWWIRRSKYRFPPGPTGLPILGYLPFLGKEPHRVLDGLSKKYGNVFALYLGRTYIVFLGDYNTVKDALSQTATLGRPTEMFDFLPDGAGFSTSNSTEWTEQRRYAVRAMRDIGLGGSKWEALLLEEIDDFLKAMTERKGNPMDCSKILTESISNNITTLVFGKRIPVGDPARKLVDRVVELATVVAGISSLRNFFPVLADLLTKLGIGQHKDLHEQFKKFSNFINKQVEERKKGEGNEDSNTLIDGYLKEIEENVKYNLKNTFNERNLRGTTLALLVAGADTTTASLVWLYIIMAKYPEIQTKVHQELHAVLGNEGRAKYSERSKLPYVNAVLMECSRWATIAPLGLVRKTLKNTKIAGYDILKGTWIMPNLWAIHRSPEFWKDPDQFIPERFLTDDGQMSASKIDGLIPFSYGKRNCPGETVAKITIFLYFTTVMQKFEIHPPIDKNPKLEGQLGLVFRPAQQELRFVPRV